MNNRYTDDDDLEIPEIDQFPGYQNTRNEQPLETTGADGIPFFLKGEEPKKNTAETEKKSGIEALKSGADPEPLPPVQEEEPEKKSSIFSRIAAVLVFLVLTAVLLFAGKTAVDSFVKQPQEAPLETVPAETAVPSILPEPTADAVE